MFVIGLLSSLAGIGLLCGLIFTLAVYAAPLFVGLVAGMGAYHSGAGVPGAVVVGAVAGGLTLALARSAFARSRSIALRLSIAVLFAVPAGMAGYDIGLDLSQPGAPSPLWREIFAWVGALAVGGTALMRLSLLTNPPTGRQDIGPVLAPRAVLTIGSRRR